MRNRRKPWFTVKRYGYGAGLPMSWEGWVVTFLYVALVMLSGMFLPPLPFILVAATVTAVFIYIARNRSNDEWRWRNGG